MDDTPRETPQELDCTVTVYDGSYMTCDMITEDAEASS